MKEGLERLSEKESQALTKEMEGIKVYVTNTSDNKLPVEITSIATGITGVDSLFKNVSFFNSTLNILSSIDKNLVEYLKSSKVSSEAIENSSPEEIPVIEESGPLSNLISGIMGKIKGKITEKAKLNPKAEDLLKATALEVAVPTGFILLHNDLQQLLGGKKPGGLKSKMAGAATGAGLSALAGTAGAAVGGFIGGALGGLFSGGDDEVNEHYNGIIKELSLDLEAKDLKTNPEIQAEVYNGFLNYLKTYFVQKNAALLGSTSGDVLASMGEGIGQGLKNLFNAVTGKESEETDKLALIVNDIIATIDSADYIGDPEVLALNHENVINYLKAYYKTQINTMQASGYIESTGAALGGAIGGFLNGAFTSLFGIKKDVGPVQQIIDTIVASIDAESFASDVEVLSINRAAIIDYLKAYYNTQIYKLNLDGYTAGTTESLGGAVGGFLNNAITSLFGRNKIDEDLAPVQAIIDKIVATQNDDSVISAYATDPEIVDISRTAIIDYLKTYYSTIVHKLTVDGYASGTTESLGGAVGGFLNNAITSLFGRNKVEEDLAPVQTIIDKLVKNINPDDFVGDPEVDKLNREGIFNYIRAYYEVQAYALKADQASDFLIDDTLTNIGQGIGGMLSSLLPWNWGKEKEEEKNPLMLALEEVIKNDPTDYKALVADSLGQFDNTKKDIVLNALTSYFNSLSTAIARGSSAFTYTDSSRKGSNLSNANISVENKVASAISTIVNNIDTTGVINSYEPTFLGTMVDNYFLEVSKPGAMQAVSWKDPSNGKLGTTSNEKLILQANSDLEYKVANKLVSIIDSLSFTEAQDTALNRTASSSVSSILQNYLTKAKESLSKVELSRTTGFTAPQMMKLNDSLINALAGSLSNAEIDTAVSFNMENKTPADDPLLLSSQRMEEHTRSIYEYMKVMNETLVELAKNSGNISILPMGNSGYQEDPDL